MQPASPVVTDGWDDSQGVFFVNEGFGFFAAVIDAVRFYFFFCPDADGLRCVKYSPSIGGLSGKGSPFAHYLLVTRIHSSAIASNVSFTTPATALSCITRRRSSIGLIP